MLEFSEWERLSLEQKKYLVQVRGPHDMFQYILRDLVNAFNVTTAAILFDDTFTIHHRSDLFMNIPVRYTFWIEKTILVSGFKLLITGTT